MARTIVYVGLLCAVVALGAGCATVFTPAWGFYTDAKWDGPLGEADEGYSKIGTATATSILGIIATGDASITTAMKNGGISTVHHVDHTSKNILGIYAEYTTVVYGE